jgi:hypothetical protein
MDHTEHHERDGVNYTLKALTQGAGFLAYWACPQCGGSGQRPNADPTASVAIKHARDDVESHHSFKHRGLGKKKS